ncbi:PPE domain-containing protein [Actinosynnema sp. NPDC051121]
MAGDSGYDIYSMASQGAGSEGLNQAADASRDARTRIQALTEELRRLTGELQAAWHGKASESAARSAQPIDRALQDAQETLDKADGALRAQAQAYGVLRQRLLPMATPEPPELTLFDEITPWDTDNELARKAWFEADANNRRAYAEYVAATSQNQGMLPQSSPASGGALGADTAVQATSGGAVRSATSAPPQVGDGATTSASSAGSAGGEKTSAPPSVGGGKTSASNAGPGDDAGGAVRAPSATGSAGQELPKLRQPSDRTAVADWSAGVPGGVPVVTTPPAGRDTAHASTAPKADHLAAGGAAAVLPGGIGIGDPTGTRGRRGPLEAGGSSAVLGRTPANGPAPVGGRGVPGKVGVAGTGGFAAPHAAHGRDEEDREHKRTVYLDEDTDALIGRLPESVAPVIGED